jgi:hypothetical protein
MTRRHEGKLAPTITERRSRQPFDRRLAFLPHAVFGEDKKVEGCAEFGFDLLEARHLDNLDLHAVCAHAAALGDIKGRNFHRRREALGSGMMLQRSNVGAE